jgi:transcriptional regulator with XRE-family HTH domain
MTQMGDRVARRGSKCAPYPFRSQMAKVQHQSPSDRLNRLFEVVKNERTGEPYTNSDIARMSLGDLSEEEVERIRNGTISNPSAAQVIALADVFGVQPSYFLDQGKKLPLIDAEAIEILRDKTVRAIAHKSLQLPDRDRQMILNIIRQFEDMQETDEVDQAMPEAPG